MTLGGFMPSARERLTRLTRTMAGERACERLIVAAAHAVDFGRVDAAIDMFAPEATFEALGTTFEGRAAIGSALESLVARHPVTRHCISSIAIHAHEDDTADGIAYLTLFGEGPSPLLVGHLRDHFVAGDGGWRIAHRRLGAVFVDPSFAWADHDGS